MSFAAILNNPGVRELVQDNFLVREMRDTIAPQTLYRREVQPELFDGKVGDTKTFTAPGLMEVRGRKRTPHADPENNGYSHEQWSASPALYADTIPVSLPTVNQAVANVLQSFHRICINASTVTDRHARNAMFAAALSGNTVTSAVVTASTQVPVVNLNGFTKARDTVTPEGSPVRYAPVSATNRLPFTYWDGSAQQTGEVIGYMADNLGDERGPGTLILASAATIPLRGWLKSSDATNVKRPGATTTSIDALTGSSVPTLAHQREVIAQLRQNRVPTFASMLYNCHLDPTSETRIMADPEFQALYRGRPEHHAVTGAELGIVNGTMYQRNMESPQPGNVVGYDANGVGAFSMDDPFPGELSNADGLVVHRMLYSGSESVTEHYIAGETYTMANGVSTTVEGLRTDDRGITMNVERITFLMREPINKLADLMDFTWKYSADWVHRTDCLSGDNQRYKRHACIEHV